MPRTSEAVGLLCQSPDCNGRLRVERVSHTASGSQTRRVRVCRICGSRWATMERLVVPNVYGKVRGVG